MSKTAIVIPARWASTRLPAKPLLPLAGKPLVRHVWERCSKVRGVDAVIIATDDMRIAVAAFEFGAEVAMTSPRHPSGTDRIAEVAARVQADGYINIQGDEPLMDPAVINAVAEALRDSDMSTASTPIQDIAEFDNPNVVKVVTTAGGRALYFSRRTIPYLRDAAQKPLPEQLASYPFQKHLGIYGFRHQTLLRLVEFPVSPLEAAEKLEQLRALENGFSIAVARVNHDSVGVDVPSDVARVEALLAAAVTTASVPHRA
jgi:3-deoxy-manno-octulosonate cytidylyltransferase (CMP-KDO synthetase)